jgi:forkhead box protein K
VRRLRVGAVEGEEVRVRVRVRVRARVRARVRVRVRVRARVRARVTMRGCAKESRATRRKACVRATRPSGHTCSGSCSR